MWPLLMVEHGIAADGRCSQPPPPFGVDPVTASATRARFATTAATATMGAARGQRVVGAGPRVSISLPEMPAPAGTARGIPLAHRGSAPRAAIGGNRAAELSPRLSGRPGFTPPPSTRRGKPCDGETPPQSFRASPMTPPGSSRQAQAGVRRPAQPVPVDLYSA